MEHHFNIEVASKCGVCEAIMLNNILFWVKHNEANKTNYYDGCYWTFNSLSAFSKLFPYWSKKQLERILKSLEINELIKTGNYNKLPFDRTKWYTVTDKTLKMYGSAIPSCISSISPNGKMDEAKKENGTTEKGRPIPYINTDNKTQIINRNNKKEKGMNALIESYTDNTDLKECIKDFIKMRAAIKKPLTDRALKILLDKLDKLESTEDRKIKVLEQSIMNSWQGIFVLKEEVTDYVKSTSNKYDPFDL